MLTGRLLLLHRLARLWRALLYPLRPLLRRLRRCLACGIKLTPETECVSDDLCYTCFLKGGTP